MTVDDDFVEDVARYAAAIDLLAQRVVDTKASIDKAVETLHHAFTTLADHRATLERFQRRNT